MITIRAETAADIEQIHYVNEKAFGRTAEADLIDKLRGRSALPVSLVAVHNNIVVGHIAFNPATIKTADAESEIITLAPLAVLPEFQKKGIGSQLIRTGLDICRKQGYSIAVLVGHPGYYPRFGFVQAKPHDIHCQFAAPDEAWMVCELVPGALKNIRGTVYFQPEFQECV